MPLTDKEIKNIHNKRREEYKYAIKHENEGYKIVEEKIKFRETLKKLKEEMEKQKRNKKKETPKKLHDLSKPDQDNQPTKRNNEKIEFNLSPIEQEIILNLRKLPNTKQEYFYHIIKAEVLKNS